MSLFPQLDLLRTPGPLGVERPLPLLMGIVNCTPDSFSDGGAFADARAAAAHARSLVDDGADILDIGGESTRPGATEVSVDEELRRVARESGHSEEKAREDSEKALATVREG